MSKSTRDALDTLALGEGAVIRGVHVVRRSLLGFQLGTRHGLLEAAEATARLDAVKRARAPLARVEICFRCGGDGLGRRDRGVCGVCHGRGAHVIEPAGGWGGATPDELAAAVEQTLSAMRAARRQRAQESLAALLTALLPLTPGAAKLRAFADLKRCGPIAGAGVRVAAVSARTI